MVPANDDESLPGGVGITKLKAEVEVAGSGFRNLYDFIEELDMDRRWVMHSFTVMQTQLALPVVRGGRIRVMAAEDVPAVPCWLGWQTEVEAREQAREKRAARARGRAGARWDGME